MKDKAKLIDVAKNFVIVLLFISAIFLLFKAVTNDSTSVYESLSKLFGGSTGERVVNQTGSVSSGNAASPVFFLTTTEDGSHYAVKYDSQIKEKIVSQFSSYLGEALGTAGTLTEVSKEQWQKALGGSGVFFDYLYPQSLSAIASWLGYETKGEIDSKTARRLFLGNNDGNLILFFINDGDGKFYSSKTTYKFSSLAPKIAEFPIGTAKFAFELDKDYAALDPYFIFSHESVTLRAVTVSNPLREGFDGLDLIGFFGMNSHVAQDYKETDGSEVYVDGEKTLRIEKMSGVISFSVTDNNGIYLNSSSGPLSITDCISACYEIAKSTVEPTFGDAVLGLINVTNALTPSSCRIDFGYFVDGIPVTLPEGGYAASFQISQGAIVKAELNCRKYTFSGGTVPALPEKQATAIADSKGGEPVLTYEDKTNSVNCTWIIN